MERIKGSKSEGLHPSPGTIQSEVLDSGDENSRVDSKGNGFSTTALSEENSPPTHSSEHHSQQSHSSRHHSQPTHSTKHRTHTSPHLQQTGFLVPHVQQPDSSQSHLKLSDSSESHLPITEYTESRLQLTISLESHRSLVPSLLSSNPQTHSQQSETSTKLVDLPLAHSQHSDSQFHNLELAETQVSLERPSQTFEELSRTTLINRGVDYSSIFDFGEADSSTVNDTSQVYYSPDSTIASESRSALPRHINIVSPKSDGSSRTIISNLTTIDSLSFASSTIYPTSISHTTFYPRTVDPITAHPTTGTSTTVHPTTVNSTTVHPTTVNSTTVHPTTVNSTTVHPTTVHSTTVHPTTVHSTTVNSTTVGSITMSSTIVNHTMNEGVAVDPARIILTSPGLTISHLPSVHTITSEPQIANLPTVDPIIGDPVSFEQTVPLRPTHVPRNRNVEGGSRSLWSRYLESCLCSCINRPHQPLERNDPDGEEHPVNNVLAFEPGAFESNTGDGVRVLSAADIAPEQPSSSHTYTLDDGQSSVPSVSPRDRCIICMTSYVNCVFLYCGHAVACMKCATKCSVCPICRQEVQRVLRIFRA